MYEKFIQFVGHIIWSTDKIAYTTNIMPDSIQFNSMQLPPEGRTKSVTNEATTAWHTGCRFPFLELSNKLAAKSITSTLLSKLICLVKFSSVLKKLSK